MSDEQKPVEYVPTVEQWAKWGADPCTDFLLGKMAREAVIYRKYAEKDRALMLEAFAGGDTVQAESHRRTFYEMQTMAGAMEQWVGLINQRIPGPAVTCACGAARHSPACAVKPWHEVT